MIPSARQYRVDENGDGTVDYAFGNPDFVSVNSAPTSSSAGNTLPARPSTSFGRRGGRDFFPKAHSITAGI